MLMSFSSTRSSVGVPFLASCAACLRRCAPGPVSLRCAPEGGAASSGLGSAGLPSVGLASDSPPLTTVQQCVVNALAAGSTITAAAEAYGVQPHDHLSLDEDSPGVLRRPPSRPRRIRPRPPRRPPPSQQPRLGNPPCHPRDRKSTRLNSSHLGI